MALTVRTNLSSMNSISQLNQTNANFSRSLARISSGMRINSARDDAAGLGVAENLDAATRSLRVAMRNANDGIAVIQTAEGAAAEVANIIKRMRELAVQSSSETLDDTERSLHPGRVRRPVHRGRSDRQRHRVQRRGPGRRQQRDPRRAGRHQQRRRQRPHRHHPRRSDRRHLGGGHRQRGPVVGGGRARTRPGDPRRGAGRRQPVSLRLRCGAEPLRERVPCAGQLRAEHRRWPSRRSATPTLRPSRPR